MLQSSHTTPSYESAKVPVTALCADDTRTADGGGGSAPRPSAARAVLGLAAVVALLLLLAARGGRGPAADLQELADTVARLARQIQGRNASDERTHRAERDALERRLAEREVELMWEKQHVASEAERGKMMAAGMHDQIVQDREVLGKMQERAITAAGASDAEKHRILAELALEHREKEELKRSLAIALEMLAEARSALPAVGGDGDPADRTLRGVRAARYQPGDTIEIIEHQPNGEIALHPGIVSDVLPNGKYNLVKLEFSTLVQYQELENFQTYNVYSEGTRALLISSEGRDLFVPVTVVGFVRGNTRPGFELHGRYRVTMDGRPEVGEIEAPAMRMHRLAVVGEMTGHGGVHDDF